MKNQEKAPLDTNKRVKGFVSGNTVLWEALAGTNEALNPLRSSSTAGKGTRGDDFRNAYD